MHYRTLHRIVYTFCLALAFSFTPKSNLQAAPPTVDNGIGPSAVSANSATLHGSLTADGAVPTTIHIYWGISDGGSNTATWASFIDLGVKPIGPFSSNIASLGPGLTYYYRCYATNADGEAWAPESTNFFTTQIPLIANENAASVTATSATIRATLISDGGAPTHVSLFWGTFDAGTIESNWSFTLPLGIQTPGSLTPALSTLTPATTYFYRFMASNSHGIGWAVSTSNFTTQAGNLQIDNLFGASNIEPDNAIFNGRLTSTGGENPHVYLYHGGNDAGTNALTWDTVIDLGIRPLMSFAVFVNNLPQNTPHYYRFFASNSTASAWAPATASLLTGRIRYVDSASLVAAAPFTSWNIAASNIQQAVDLAADGDLILVTNGLYNANSAVFSNMENRIVVTTPITIRSVNGPAVTLIEGAGPNGPSAVRCAVLQNGARLFGFTLTNGHTHTSGDLAFEQRGGGALLFDKALVGNCVITMNAAANYAGGINCAGGATIESSDILNNSALAAGGLLCSSGTVRNCRILGNTATQNAAGASLLSFAVMENCLVSNNTAVTRAGGVEINTFGTVSNCTIIANQASDSVAAGGGLALTGGGIVHASRILYNQSGLEGGGIYMQNGGKIRNSLIAHNIANGDGGGIKCFNGGFVENCTITHNEADADQNLSGQGGGLWANTNAHINSIVFFNKVFTGPSSNINFTAGASLQYSCVAPTNTAGIGPGILMADPLFVDTNNLDYMLLPASPCRNAGQNQPWMFTSRTLNNTQRIMEGTVDIGATEFNPAPAVDNLPPSLIIGTTATLKGNLLSTGAGPTTVFLFWGHNDGGMNPNAWSNSANLGILATGTFSNNVTGLIPNTVYYYRAFASNSTGYAWAPNSASFQPTALFLELNSGSHGTLNQSSAWHPTGAVVSVTATPEPGYKFVGWVGDFASTHSTLVITMQQNYAVSAYFATNDGAHGEISFVNYGFHPSLALSHLEEALHLTFYDGDHLQHAKKPKAAGWTFDPIDTSHQHVGQYSSLALSTNDDPHVLYSDFLNDPNILTYATPSTNGWTISGVATGSLLHEISLAVTTNGNLLASFGIFPFFNNSYREIQFAQFNGATWNTGLIDNDGWSGSANSLCIDPTVDRPAVTYSEEAGRKLKFAQFTGTNWLTSVVATNIQKAQSAIRFDSAAQPHLVFVDSANRLCYATLFTNSWITETVLATNASANPVKLEFDAADNPHILYSTTHPPNGIEPTPLSLIYAVRHAGQWTQTPIVPQSTSLEPNQRLDLKVTSNGTPFAVYVDTAQNGRGLYLYTITNSIPPPNNPPQWTSIPPTNATIGQTYTYSLTAFDQDNDTLGFLAISLPSWLALNSNLLGIVSTLVGTGATGAAGDGGPALNAKLTNPTCVALDKTGNLYIADEYNHRIRKVDAQTHIITTVAGNGVQAYAGEGIPATNASLNIPSGVALDNANNLYIADQGNSRIRKVDATTGLIKTIVGTGVDGYSGDNGPATNAQLNLPFRVTVDNAGNLYIADNANNRIRKVDSETGFISTIAGTGINGYTGDNGPATNAQLYAPTDVALDSSGNIYIVDNGNSVIRKIDFETQFIRTIAGTGVDTHSGDGGAATNAALHNPLGMALDRSDNLYVACYMGQRIRRIDSVSGIITTIMGTGIDGYSGDGGAATNAQVNYPTDVDIDSAGNVYVVDFSNHRIRRIVSGCIASGVPTPADLGTHSVVFEVSDSITNIQQTFQILVQGAPQLMTASAGTHGAIAPNGSTNVPYGTDLTYTILPDIGYHIANVLADGVSVGPVTSHTFTNIVAAHTISATFAINLYDIYAAASGNGTTMPTGSVMVSHGASTNFTITPAPHYHSVSTVVDSVDVGPTNAYTFSNVTTSHTLTAFFDIDTHTLSVASLLGAAQPPVGTITNPYGTTLTCTNDAIVAFGTTQCVNKGWTGTGSVPAAGSSNSVTFTLTNDSSITWLWTTNYQLTTSGNTPSGSVDIASQWMPAGSNVTLTATPSFGYHFLNWAGDTNNCTLTGAQITAPMTTPRQIEAVFQINTYTLTANAGTNGSVTPTGAIPVTHGASTNLTIMPGPHYHSVSTVVDGIDIGPTNAYAFSNVTNNHTLAAFFAIDTHALSVASLFGAAQPPVGSVTNPYGTTVTCTNDAIKTIGTTQYVNKGWAGTGSVPAAGSSNNVTFTLTNDSSITWLWTTNYQLTTSGNTPSGNVDTASQWLPAGSNVTLTATPAIGYHFLNWSGNTNSCTLTGDQITAPMTTPRQIEAIFQINTYTLTANAGTNGSVTPNGAIPVTHGAQTNFIIIPSPHYHSVSTVVDSIDIGPTNAYSFSNVTNNHTLTAFFAIDTHALSVASLFGAAQPPVGSVTNPYGTTVTCTNDAIKTIGTTQYVNKGWAGTGSVPAAGSSNNVTFTLTNDSSITWLWTTNYQLTTSGNTPSGNVDTASQWLPASSNVTLTATPAIGYHFLNWSGNTNSCTLTGAQITVPMTTPRQIEAIFQINTYTLTANSGTNGSVTPNGAIPVTHGAQTNFTIIPSPHYHSISTVVDSIDIGPTNAYSFSNVTNNHTLAAFFDIDTHALSVASLFGAPQPPLGSVTNPYGTTVTCTNDAIVIDGATQYVMKGWAGTGSVPTTGFSNSVTFTLTNDSSITWLWTTNYRLSISDSPPSGTVDTATQWVPAGSNVTLTATPSFGYHFLNWSGHTNNCTLTGTQITVPMTSHRQIEAIFQINTYTITANADTNGSVTPSDATPVTHGSQTNFTITPSPHYHSVSTVVDSIDIGPTNAYSFSNVTNNHTLAAFFAIDTHALSVASLFGAAHPPVGTVTNPYGTTVTCTNDAIVTVGTTQYINKGWTGTGSVPSTGFSNNVTFTLTNSSSIIWLWTTNYLLTTSGSTPSGSVDTASQWVPAGSNVTLTATPAIGYHFLNWSGNTNNCTLTGTQITAPMTSHRQIEAIFQINTYTITANAGTNGSVTPSGAIPVTHGAQTNVTITPSPHYHSVSTVVDGIDIGPTNAYAFSNVTNNHALAAFFDIDTHALSVASLFGAAQPPVGTVTNPYGTTLTCTNSAIVTVGTTQYVNKGWAGTGSVPATGSSNNVTFNLANDSSITWLWTTNYLLTTSGNTPSGSVDTASQWMSANSNVTLMATPAFGYHFLNWAGNTNNCTLTGAQITAPMTTPRQILAQFQINSYTVTATAGPNGAISPAGASHVTHASQANFVITPSPNFHSVSTLVDGIDIGPTNAYTFVNVTNQHRIAAFFAIDQVSLSVTSQYGTPNPATGVTFHSYGTTLNCGNTPLVTSGATQYVSKGWTGTGSVPPFGLDSSVQIVITNHSTIDWVWKTQFQLLATATPGGSVSSSGGWFDAATLVLLTATPPRDSHFSRWTGDVPPANATDNPLTLPMDMARTVVATFAPDAGSLTLTIAPPAAAAAGALWRVANGPDSSWKTSGATAPDLLTTGTPYTIEFAPIPGWTEPPPYTLATASNASLLDLTARYLPGTMKYIRGGSFLMGSVNGANGSLVTLDDYLLDSREVTVADYLAFIAASGGAASLPPKPAWDWSDTNLPIVNVSWNEAAAYAAWAGKRLPTEAEFEYAMRGGNQDRLYPWGNQLETNLANYGHTRRSPTPAGTYPATSFDLFDIAGNVWEWCRDWTNNIPAPAANPAGPSVGTLKAIRSGSWINQPDRMQCAARFAIAPASRFTDLGFRCALPATDSRITTNSTAGTKGTPTDWWTQLHFGARPGIPDGFDANQDDDADGLNNAQEFLAGTDPTVASSVLATIPSATSSANESFVIQWLSKTNRLYTVEWCPSLNGSFKPLKTSIPGNGALNCYTAATHDAHSAYYRVKVQPQP